MQNFILLFSLLYIFSCDGQDKKEVSQKDQITYSIDATATIPVVIYFNDIKISEENTPVNSSVDLNAFALKNGKYKVKIQIFPVFRRGDTSVSPGDIKSCKFNFVSFIRNKETQDISQYNTISQLSIKIPEAPVPYFEQEWEVDLTKLPYDLNGWNTREDLRKMNQKELEKKVINYHEKKRIYVEKGDYSLIKEKDLLRIIYFDKVNIPSEAFHNDKQIRNISFF